MNESYLEIFAAKRDDRRQLFSEATEEWPTSANFIEKDFMVCAAMNVLFGDDPSEASKLVFKGGTSLSKAHNLIRRFSEDIDIVLIREELGFKGDRDPFDLENDLSRKGRTRLMDELQAEAGRHVQTQIRPMLEQALGPIGAVVETDPGSMGQTLLVSYPSVFDERDAYVDPIIKVEAGARSATLPAHLTAIVPYVASVIDGHGLTVEGVQTVDAERTFLDKVLILHGRHCKFRDTGEIHRNANRESRHYYDLAMMAEEIGPRALADKDLLADVIQHSSLAFSSAWMRMDEAKEGNIVITPPDGMIAALRKDYQAMTGMILGEAPGFDWILEKIVTIDALHSPQTS